MPIAASFALLGVNDFSFVLYPLLASLGSVVVVCLIGTALYDAGVGLIAAALVAVAPWDIAFASTMAIDLIASFLTALAVYGLVMGGRSRGWRAAAAYAAAAGALWLDYLVKEPATFLLPGFFAILALVNPGDAVIFHDPYFVSYLQLVNMVGGKPVTVSSTASVDISLGRRTAPGFGFDLLALRARRTSNARDPPILFQASVPPHSRQGALF